AGRHDQLAIAHYDNAIALQPTSIEAHYNKAKFMQEHGRAAEALKEYEIILKINPDHFPAHFNIGYVYMIYLEEYEQAVDHFSRAISYAPDKYYEAYYNRGYAYELMNNKVEAEKNFRTALAIKPDYNLAAKGISRVVDGDYR
ncbi:MAG: tetratricopeptide repeat protein, partial [Bacteroidota bacterium]